MSGRIGSAAFIGRTDELATLTAAWDRTADAPAIVVIGGEAGVGKTRLVSEFVEALPDDRLLLQGGCLELGQAVMPYAPLVGVLRQLSRSVGPDRTKELYGETLSRFLPEHERPVPDEDGYGQSALFESVLQLFGKLATESRLVVVLEDLHWADWSTLDLLSFLARNLSPTPVLLIVTYRSDEMRRTHPLRPVLAELTRLPDVTRVNLEPLNEAEVASLMAAINGEQPPKEQTERVVARSEGNPFFVEELLAADALSAGELPSSLRDVLAARLDTLPAPAKEVLRIAAAAGRRVDYRLLEHFVELDPEELYAGLRAAVDSAALVADPDGGWYRFRHALLQEAVHEQLLPGERTRLHAAFAAALVKDPALAAGGRDAVDSELAYHALAAHDVSLAFSSLVRAGRRARDLLAFAEAQEHFEKAAELRPRLELEPSYDAPPVWELLRNAALCNRYAGTSNRVAIGHLRHAIESVGPDGDRAVLAGLYAELSESLWMGGRGDEAVEASDSSVDVIGDVVAREGAEALAWRSRLFMLLGRYEESIRPGRAAVGLARSLDAKRELSRAANSLGTSLSVVGDAEEGLRLLLESIEIGKQCAPTEAVRGYVNLASTLRLPSNNVAESERVARAGLAYGESLQLQGAIIDWLTLELVDGLMRQGRLGECEELLGTVRSPSMEGVNGHYFESLLATLRIVQGRYDEAEVHLQRAERLAPSIRDPQAIAPNVASRLQIGLARGEVAVAGTLEQIEPMLTDPNVFVVLPMLARVEAAAALAGDEDAADRIAGLLAKLADIRDAADPRSPVAANAEEWLAVVAAELGRARGVSSAEEWRTALTAMRTGGWVEQQLYAGFRLGEALLAAGDSAAAKQELAIAHAGATSMGAAPLAEQVEDLAVRARLTLPGVSGPEPDRTVGLTSREREVLGLLADGRTNREIGTALFISQKTASVHVSNILAKLGVANRGQAVAKARRLGI